MSDDRFVLPSEVREIKPRINSSPLQQASGDRLVRSTRFGGPDQPADRKLVIHAKVLQHLLDVARSSAVYQVELPCVGLKIDLYVDGTGHQYEVWTFESGEPRPEATPTGVAGFLNP